VEHVVAHLKSQGTPEYLEAVTAEVEEDGPGSAVFDKGDFGSNDDGADLYRQAVQIVLRDRKATTSYSQWRHSFG
jgi:S-DNA-T family DNA segregation ATPase FtsK/SpoIIIE